MIRFTPIFIITLTALILNSCEKQEFRKKYEGKYLVKIVTSSSSQPNNFTYNEYSEIIEVKHNRKTKNQVFIIKENSPKDYSNPLFCPSINESGEFEFAKHPSVYGYYSGTILNDSIYLEQGLRAKTLNNSTVYSGKKIE